MDTSRLRFPLIIGLTGLLLGLVSDLLLYGQPLGISVPIVLTLVVASLLILSAVEGVKLVWANLWLVLPLLFMAAMSAVRAAPTLRFLNINGALLLLGLLASGLATRPLVGMGLGHYVEAAIESAMLSLVAPFPLLLRTLRTLQQNSGDVGRWTRRVLIGLAIAAPFLCIFTILFASADLVFGSYLEDFFESFNVVDLVGHTLLTALLAWIITGGLGFALSRTPAWRGLFTGLASKPSLPDLSPDTSPDDAARAQAEAASSAASDNVSPKLRGWLGIVEAAVVLFSVDVLFLVFVLIQFAALFGGETFLRSRGLTYSEYARRGFFELLAVSLITLGLILLLDYVTRRETKAQRFVFLLGSTLMIAMTVIILASAFQRLQLYELAYGFTSLRVYSHVFMIWLAVLMVYVLAFLFFSRSHLFATGALGAALGFIITLDVLNPDAFIVRQNVARYERGEGLDVAYLGTLSEDAVPLLMPLLYEYGPEIGAQVGPWLRYHLDQLDRRQDGAGWPAYHASINRAYRVLDLNRGLIEQFDPPPSRWPGYE